MKRGEKPRQSLRRDRCMQAKKKFIVDKTVLKGWNLFCFFPRTAFDNLVLN